MTSVSETRYTWKEIDRLYYEQQEEKKSPPAKKKAVRVRTNSPTTCGSESSKECG